MNNSNNKTFPDPLVKLICDEEQTITAAPCVMSRMACATRTDKAAFARCRKLSKLPATDLCLARPKRGPRLTNTICSTAVRDLSGEEHFSYDARARMVSQTKRIPDPGFLSLSAPGGEGQGEVALISFTTGYTYDSLDRLVNLTYPDVDQVAHLYNPRGLLRQITGGPSGSILSNIAYRASGQLATIAYGNNVSTAYDYDPRLRLTDLDTDSFGAGKLIDFHYSFDAASNIER